MIIILTLSLINMIYWHNFFAIYLLQLLACSSKPKIILVKHEFKFNYGKIEFSNKFYE